MVRCRSRCAALGCTACAPTDFLEVTDPDIINPSDVQSAAGANAVRLGALARLNRATSGGSDRRRKACSCSAACSPTSGTTATRSSPARRSISASITLQNSFLTDANRVLHRARLSAEQAVELLAEFNPTGPAADVAEMYFVQAYVENIIGRALLQRLVFSTSSTAPRSTARRSRRRRRLQRALAHADSGLALVTGTTTADVRVRNALRGDQGPDSAEPEPCRRCGAAVAACRRTSGTDISTRRPPTDNPIWTFNNIARRYSVSTGEGTNGLNFATANDPRVRICLGGDAVCVADGTTPTRRDDNSHRRCTCS